MRVDHYFDWKAAAASTLDWWHEAGIEWLTTDEPRDWQARSAEHAAPMPGREPAEQRAAATPTAVPMPQTLGVFEQWRLGADAPDTAIPGVRIGARGPAGAALMVVVDAPEREDAVAGQVLSGAAGRLLDQMMAAIGLPVSQLYLAPMCVVRPAAARFTPEMEHLLGDVLRHQISLVAPGCVLILSNAPSRALLGMDITTARGSLRSVNHAGGQTQAIASFHPRFLIERPAAKAEAWKDLQLLPLGSTN